MYFECENLKEVYDKAGKCLIMNGEETSPRGLKIKELINVSFMIKNPMERLVYRHGRKFNLCFALTEALMLVNCRDYVRYFSKFNKNVERFSDDGMTMHGCYGRRISDNLQGIVDKLLADKYSRQAVLNIYSSNLDLEEKTKDVPCTETLQFLIRGDKLHMIVNMRSNDIIWGTQYDVFMFTCLQEVIANTLGVELGYYYHNAGSFHVYEDSYNILADMADGTSKSVEFKGLKGITLGQYKNMSHKYCSVVDGKTEYVSEKLSSSIEKILSKQITYDIMKNSREEFEKIDTDSIEWSLDFTKRWRK